jgi:hypothetical protein
VSPKNGNDEVTAAGASLVPTLVISAITPGTVGVNPSPLVTQGSPSLVLPYAFIKSASATALSGVTNLTQRQAAFLEGAAGTNAAGDFASTSGGGAG